VSTLRTAIDLAHAADTAMQQTNFALQSVSPRDLEAEANRTLEANRAEKLTVDTTSSRFNNTSIFKCHLLYKDNIF